MSLCCFGRYGAEAECCFCGAKEECAVATRKKFKRWVKSVEHPKPEVEKWEHEIELTEKAQERWFLRQKVRERHGV